MANKKVQLSKGAQGSHVLDLQNALVSKGYNLKADGIFGNETLAAVQDYQKRNGLAVDGIVGDMTWASLDPTPAIAPINQKNAGNPYTDIDLSRYDGGYQKSDTVTEADNKAAQAWDKVENHGDFQYGKQDALDAIYDQIMNREKFSYDINGDMLYQQYKDQYVKQGQMAMMDTMGQAAAMNGGYGSSYGQAVGQQAYNASLEQLNEVVPELYQMALNQYQSEGQDLYNKYGMLTDDKQMEYGMHADEYNRLLGQAEYMAGRADSEYAKDYGQWSDQRDFDTEQYWQETAFGYQQVQDQIAQQQWQDEYNLKVKQIEEDIRHNKITEAQGQAQIDLAKRELAAKLAGSGSGSGGGSDGGSGSGGGNKGNGGNNGNNGSGGGFTGSNYSEAVAYMKSKGVDGAYASGVMTKSEWARRKASGSSSGAANNYKSYAEYLADFVEYAVSTKGK